MSTESFLWQRHVETLLPNNACYFWSLVLARAEKEVGRNTVYLGEYWISRVNAKAEEILSQLKVSWERYAGQLYIAGKRVYLSFQGKWEQDDWRP